MHDRIGQQLGNYRLKRRLGQGGFGEVYLGEHVHLNTQAAIKLLYQVQLPSEEEAKFRKEAATIAKLNHQHIVRVLDYGIQESTNTPFLVMEFAPKGTVQQRYPRGKILSPLHIWPYVIQVARALQYAHDRMVIHRDVKPENMLLDEHDNIRLSDFGIAVIYESTSSPHTVDMLGTPPYMAPEQFRGKPVYASDQYALGIVIYEWLCGNRPFNGTYAQLAYQHEHDEPPSMCEKIPSLSPAIEKVVQKALSKDPKERYPTVKEFSLAFQKACEVEQARSGSERTSSMSSPLVSLTKRVKPIVATPPQDSSVIWNVPHNRNMFFTGREQILISLHDTFCSQKRVIQTQALSGLGGIGKTQIAIEYVYRYHSAYRYIFWVRGDTREKMLSDFASLAALLEPNEQHECEQQRIIESVRSSLRKKTHWLLIIDAIEDLKHARTILPTSARGHILLTTRTKTTGNIAQHIDLEKMTPEDGALFLLRRTKILAQDASLEEASTSDYQHAKDVVEMLDGLPLALDQAGAYIEESGCNLSHYLHRYQERPLKLLSKRGGFDFHHPASVTETFSYSLEKIKKISPAAVELLRFCAFLDPDGIPEELLIHSAAELGPILQPVASDPFLLDETLAILRNFSFIRRNSNMNTLSLHRLVQGVLKDCMNEKTQRAWVERTVRAINLALPDIREFSQWQRCRQYMPHVQKCVALIEEWKIVSPEAARILEQTGMYLQVQAYYAQAFDLFGKASDMYSMLTEAEPASTIASHVHIFRHYYAQGQNVQAEQILRKALRLVEQTSGFEPLTRATCLEAMGFLSNRQGKYNHAEEYFLEALILYEESIGLQHSLVACTYCGLGNVYLALAKYDRAESFYQDALNIWQQVSKPQHPLMCTSLNGLAQISMALGNYVQAELYLQQERTHIEQTLQPLHPTLAHNLNDWALLLIAQGKYHQVEPLLVQSLKIIEKSVGLRHPLAGSILDTLGRIAFLNGKKSRSEQFFQKAQGILEEALGEEHPDVLTTINNLADIYKEQGKLSLAGELFKDVLAVRIRILGPDHPSVAQTLHSMAQVSYFYGHYAESEQQYNQALTIRKKVLGPEHPDVAQNLHGLAEIYFWKWKKIDLAQSLLQQAIAIYEKPHLKVHPTLAQILT
ncbi:MAG TPA: FxSxx-COOH system tetratricopeptide repeat protein, partial [Ktedonobacteraceae bacterium]|nr:FxSxx-COOH system tetratricopeptide repeat protein [Ktedonobacteraceae bacterium]